MGGNEAETTTTGSATVRILRPPIRSLAAASLKLEKTPTLNNESVIKLVEAGFSEGTIIKRIEESPADFDLSTAKLLELRRRRVTDAIIAAMTAAMSDESETQSVIARQDQREVVQWAAVLASATFSKVVLALVPVCRVCRFSQRPSPSPNLHPLHQQIRKTRRSILTM